MSPIVAADIPADSALQSWLERADFHDAWEAPLDDGSLSPTEIFLRCTRATPSWVSTLMRIRNRIVPLLGVRSVGRLTVRAPRPAEAYRPGDWLGLFQVLATSERELLLGVDDSHLDVRISVAKRTCENRARVVVSTAVRIHNTIGRLYMGPVGRIHPFVVRALMRRASA